MPAPTSAQQVSAFLATDKYHGLMIDFETFSKKGQPGYLALLQELSDDLHAKGMKLYVSVQARNDGIRLRRGRRPRRWRRADEL